MKKISTDRLEPGMQLGRPALSNTGTVLLEAGSFLNKEYIEKLIHWKIEDVFVIDTSTADELAEEQERLLTKEFEATHRRAMDFTKQFMDKAALGETPRESGIENPVFELMEKLLIKPDVLFKLIGIYSVDNYLYAHAVNTAVLALLLGMKLELDRENLTDLGTASLLADVGMSLIPPSVYSHQGPLTEEQRQIICAHPDHGVTILKHIPKIKGNVLEAVRQHHERIDGSGYPQGLKGDRISLHARIIAVSDVFAAIREPRAHREQSPPRRALKALTADSGFDPGILRTVFATLSVYPVQSVVRLSNGFVGTVVGVTENNPFRPIIKLLQDETGQAVPASRIDLTKPENISLYVETVLDFLPKP